MQINKSLINYIKEARKRGFDDYQIREPLLKNGWPSQQVEQAFEKLRPKINFKDKVTVYLNSDVLKHIEKRAKKNMLTLPEQIEDILRRSCINAKKTKKEEKLDDMLVSLFSRRRYDRK